MDKNIKSECEEFCKAMGSEGWGDAQMNSMQTSFYSGALVAFHLFSEMSANENEDIAVTQIDNLYNNINFNIKEQRKLMKEIWNKKS